MFSYLLTLSYMLVQVKTTSVDSSAVVATVGLTT